MNRKGVYLQLTKPLYELTQNDSEEAVLKQVDCLCTQLRLDQRQITILGIRKDIGQQSIKLVISRHNQQLTDDRDPYRLSVKRESLKDYDVLIIYKEELYFKIFTEACGKRKYLSPHLFHYLFSQLFGYSDRVLKLFLSKWVD